MDPAFWTGLFGCIGVVVIGVLAHLKNVEQDRAALKRDTRLAVLESEVKHCNEERAVLILAALKSDVSDAKK